MDGETNGGQETTQGAQDTLQQQGQEQQETPQGQSRVETPDYEKQIAERDEKIASLEAQVAEAAKNPETVERLRGEIAELKSQGESDRIDFKLRLAGVRNVKAARALLSDHDNDVDKLREAEPWLFEASVCVPAHARFVSSKWHAARITRSMTRWHAIYNGSMPMQCLVGIKRGEDP